MASRLTYFGIPLDYWLVGFGSVWVAGRVGNLIAPELIRTKPMFVAIPAFIIGPALYMKYIDD
jgi:hypothetical protein